jgi:SAM-dependent methyltransferase
VEKPESNLELWDEKRAKAWHLFMPPARPSVAEVSIYNHFLKKEKNKKKKIEILLLGSTPELRSIAHASGCSLTCVDFNATVFHILSNMVSHKGIESFHCCNWLEINTARRFDIIFGDGSINMLPGTKHREFLIKVNELLKDDGIAVLRVHVILQPAFKDPLEVFKWYRNTDKKEAIFTATRNHLDMLWLNYKTLGIDFVEFHKKIREMYNKKLITHDEFNAYDKLLEYNKITLYFCNKEVFEEYLKGLFDITVVMYGKDHSNYLYHPVYCLRKNKR